LSDIFREVEEDLRREQLRGLWDKYGIYVLGLAAGIVLATAAVVGWRAYSENQAEKASAAYEEALAAAQADEGAAADLFADIAEKSPAGYAALARLQEAAALAEAGETDKAVAAYEELAASGSDALLTGLAQIKAAALVMSETSYDDMQLRLGPLAGEGLPWRNFARELLGLSAYEAGRYEESQAHFEEITNDAAATPGLRDRAHVMLAMIAPHVALAGDAAGETEDEAVPAPEEDAESAQTEADAD